MIDNKRHIVFHHVSVESIDGAKVPVTQKKITLDSAGALKYYIYDHLVSVTNDSTLPTSVTTVDDIIQILAKFQKKKVCQGFLMNDDKLVSLHGLLKIGDHFHSHKCTFLVCGRRCPPCKTAFQQNNRTIKRLTKLKNAKKIRTVNIESKIIKHVFKKRLHTEEVRRFRAEKKIESLKKELKEKCDELNKIKTVFFK